MGSIIPNQIGQFGIGISPIGTQPGLDYVDTLMSQYANSPTLVQLISNFATYISTAQAIDAFFDLMWNVNSAQGYGLDVWGRIVGIGRVLQVANGKFLGFKEATSTSADPFNQSPFYSGQTTTGNFPLSDTSFRLLIFAKAAANISNGSVMSINAILNLLFPGRGRCYVTDGLNMTMTYTFHFILSPSEAAIVQGSNVLPRPAGVSATVVQVTP